MGTGPLILPLSILAAAGLSWALVRQFCRPSSRLYWLDRPNDRSLHDRPTPRTGGIGIMIGTTAGWALAGMPMALAFAASIALTAVSLWDDAKGLPVAWRLISHVAAAAALVLAAGEPLWPACGLILAIVWMTNLYNFMDGSDGLAGGMALFGFLAYAVAAGRQDAGDLASLAMLVAAAGAGFLPFNFSPARIFMGDAGSIPLGFLAAALGFEGWRREIWPAWFPLLVFSPFVADATVTLLRRAWRRQPVWRAHREHAYQKLVCLGWSHRRVAVHAYGLMLAAGLSALLLATRPVHWQWLGLAGWAVIYALVFLAVELRWRRFGGTLP